jgi:hypothetical protein
MSDDDDELLSKNRAMDELIYKQISMSRKTVRDS